MSETHSCTHPGCDKVFTKAYELKKHKATHENPNSVFHCPHCDFITLQKKNLAIHFTIHTGEKNYECPDMIRTDDHEQRCEYRTNDPAALTKHRKKAHRYIPPPNRSRPKAAPASPCKTRQQKQEKVTRRRRRTPRVALTPRRKAARSPRKAKNPFSDPSDTPTCANPTLDVDGNAMLTQSFGYEPNATLIGTDDEIGMDTLFDPTLRSQWMAQYENSYTAFDMTGMKHQLDTLAEDPSVNLAALVDERTGREGCLCPEWMVEAGIEGWDASVLGTHKEYYVIDA